MNEQAEVTYYTQDDTGGYVEAKLPSFHETLPETLRDHEALKEMDPAKLAQEFVDLKSNTPQVPENADAYEIPEVPEGVPLDEEALKGFKAFAHENGISQELFQKILSLDFERAQKYMADDTEAAEAAKKEIELAREASSKALDKEWGSTRGAKEELVAKVKTRFFSESLIKKLDESGLGDDAEFMMAMAAFGGVIDEGHLILPDTTPRGEIPRSADGRPILDYSTVDR